MMNRTAISLLGAGLALLASTTAKAFDFEFPVVVSPPVAAETVAIGDFNGDRLDDVVIATGRLSSFPDTYNLLVTHQRPDGNSELAFWHQYTHYTEYSTASVALAAADLNGDGDQEILVGHLQGMDILDADQSGAYHVNEIDSDIGYRNVATLDVDRDGNIDVVAQSWSEGADILYGDGTGGIRSVERLATPAERFNDIKTGDVTGDGIADLVIVSADLPTFVIYPVKATGGFAEPLDYALPDGAGGQVFAAAVGDFDDDGANELILASVQEGSNLFLFEQDGEGGLSDAFQTIPTADNPSVMITSDLDGDGKVDLLVGHREIGSIGSYIQGSDGLLPEQLHQAYTAAGFAHTLATGDLDDNGCTDAENADTGVVVFLRGIECPPRKSRSDFNGDGVSDLLWHNDATLANSIWNSADYATQQAVVKVRSAEWTIAATGDFDGDGRADILWHNDVTGASAIWKSGDYATQQAVIRVRDTNWKIVGAADFDGDGKDDIFWHSDATGANAIWKSGNYATQQAVTRITDLNWRIAGFGDFDGDGRADVLWRHFATGRNTVWLAADYRTQMPVTDITNLDWSVAGIGDFDGDRKDDVLWRHSTGGLTIWRSASYQRQLALPKQPTRWRLGAIGDYDGNGKDDLVWRNTLTGENLIWRAASHSVIRRLTTVTNQGWQLEP